MRSRIFSVVLLIGLSALPAHAQDERRELWDSNSGSYVGLSLGYVTKDWSTDFHDGKSKYHEDLWGNENRRLHGFQVGFYYRPISNYGFGLSTGVYAEGYFSSGIDYGYDRYKEWSIYVPLHLALQVPITHSLSLNLSAGPSFSYVVNNEFTNDGEFYYDYDGSRHYYILDKVDYGHFGWPKRYNFAIELTAGLRIGSCEVKALYSYGLTDHHLYPDKSSSETRQHKLGISIGFETNCGR